MKLSIVIPVYNVAKYVKKCVDSCYNQPVSHELYEIIIINDGSTDDSLSMLNGWAAKDPRFRVVSHEKNSSLLAARFTGMKEARGKVVIFLDSDDYIDSSMLMEIHDKYEATQADIIRFGFVTEPMGKTWTPSLCDDLLSGYLDGDFSPSIWKNAYAACVIEGARRTGESFYCNMGEDSYMTGVLFSNAKTHVDMDRVFYHYVFEGGMSALPKSSSLKAIRKQYDSVMASGTHLISYMEKYKPEYVEKAKNGLKNMLKYVLLTNLYSEKDPVNAVRCVSLFDQEDTQDIFAYGCRELLREKYRRAAGEGGFILNNGNKFRY